MEYRVEIELGNGTSRRATYYYRCPRCGYRVQDLVLTVKRSDGTIRVEVREYSIVVSR
jgi:DNA-directed RNA polymerase subunit RPC12/RpoP